MSKTFGMIGGGGGGIKLASIAITTPPAKTTYTAGETFDPAGMVVEATYSNGAKAIATGYSFTPSTALMGGTTEVTIQYTEAGVTKTVEQAITVSKAAGSLSISTDSLTLDSANPTGEIIVDRAGDGAISAVSSATDIVSVSVSGNIVKVTGKASGNATITISVAEGTNHAAPASKVCAVTVRLVTIYGVQWDGTSTTAMSRTDAAAGFTDPVPYVAGASAYSSPFDNLQPWAGMVRVTDSEAGELVAIPKFWYKLTKSGNTLKLQIAPDKVDGFYVSPAHADRGDGKGERDIVYVGRYHSCGTYKSTTGQAPKASITRSTARTNIHNLGTTIWQFDLAMRQTIQMLYLVEFADWNSQTKIGYGCSASGSKANNGQTDAMQYHTGTTAENRTTYGFTQYRYIEGLWDNVCDWTDGCYYSSAGLSIILNPSNFSDTENGTAIGMPSDGYPTVMSVEEVGGVQWMYPTTANGSGQTYIPDYWGFSASFPCLCCGGKYHKFLSHGLFYVEFCRTSDSGGYIGCRIQKLP